MKKILFTVSFLVLGSAVTFAQKYITRTGKISFSATAPASPEKIEGINNEVACIVDSKSGAIVFQAPVKSFKFERELMKEHFNENYMESDNFPKAEFKGTLSKLAEINFAKDGNYTAKVTGSLTMHGVTNTVTTTGTLQVKGNEIVLKAKFAVKLDDYKIKIPGAVADKISKEAKITVDGELTQK